MKNKKNSMLFLMIVLMILLAGVSCYMVVITTQGDRVEERGKEGTFAKWTEDEYFQDIPYVDKEGIRVGEAGDYGDNNHVISVDGGGLNLYQEYLNMFQEAGFEKYVDNGENGLNNSVYTTTFTSDKYVLTISHVVNIDKTYISVSDVRPLSEHLFYKEEYIADVKQGAQTKLHMMEMYDFGNSFVYQLKNGHFIIEDGGTEKDAPYLLDFLESLTDEGEKPVIEAWFVSHAHSDHVGALWAIAKNKGYSSLIDVEGIYYCAASLEQNLIAGTEVNDEYMRGVANLFQTTTGEKAKLYRPKTGERYYFCDITVDIVHCQEQLASYNRDKNANSYSSVLMYTIEGQKVLSGGDSDNGVMRNLMRTYGKDYLTVDVFMALHHGINTLSLFTDYCSAKTVLFTSWSTKGQNKNLVQAENQYLKDCAEEYYAWGKGTVVLTFPYTVGTAEILPLNQWIYNGGVRVFSDEIKDVLPTEYE